MDELLAEFIAETRETLDKISSDLVAWEADPADRSRLDEIFRFIHTVKGSCGFLDLPRLEKLSHCTEDALQSFRTGNPDASHVLVSTVLAIIDRIGVLVDRLEQGESIEDGSDDDLIEALVKGGVAPGPAPSSIASPQSERAGPRSIRVPVELLDQLMGGVSDLVLARNELARRLRGIDSDAALDSAFERMSQRIAEIRDAVTWTRMQRIESLFAAVPRLVRDLADQLGKEVKLKIEGEDVELDREMIEMLRDPLTHAVRNALDHGIEPAEQRLEDGKPAAGTIDLSARQSGNRIEITIRDDGAGIDTDSLGRRAVAAGLISTDQREALNEQALLDLIFEPGLSVVEEATAISGRGVGMDVVRANVERIGGSITVASDPGRGTTLTLSVPLTLTIIPALIVGVGPDQFALPRLVIEEIVGTGKNAVQIERIGESETVLVRSERLPLVRAADILGVRPDRAASRPDDAEDIVIVLGLGRGRRFALLVSTVHDHEELVVKPAAPMLMTSGAFAGTALPDNGRPVLLLDAAGIAGRAGLSLSPSIEIDISSAESGDRNLLETLVFEDLDGRRRAIPMALVDRIQAVNIAHISRTAGVLRANVDSELVPLIVSGDLPPAGDVRLLRLSDGHRDCAYAFAGQADAIDFPADYRRAPKPGMVAGVGIVDGRPVELLDVHFLLSHSGSAAAPGGAARCRIVADDEGWARSLLGPLVELAGYQVVYGDAGDDPADLLLVADEDETGDETSAVEHRDVLYLSNMRDAGPGRVYRYDHEGIFEALRDRLRAGGGR